MTKRFVMMDDFESWFIFDKLQEYTDEHGVPSTDMNNMIPMNKIDVVDLLNDLHEENEQLKQQLQKIQDSFEFHWSQNHVEYDKDTLHIKDNNTEIRLNGTNLFIEVYIPQINDYYRFKYRVTGRSLMREFIENYNSKEDME